MVWLQYGDRLPTVAVVQYLLGFLSHEVNCIFDNKTKKAVFDFQQLHQPALKIDGVVGPETWKKLNTYKNFDLLNVLDMSAPNDSSITYEAAWYKANHNLTLFSGHHQNTYEWMFRKARQNNSTTKIPLMMLRISGHGAPGYQKLSLHRKESPRHWLPNGQSSCLDPYTLFQKPNGKPFCEITIQGTVLGYKPYLFEWGILYLRLLRNLFCPFGSIEMHGCNVANG